MNSIVQDWAAELGLRHQGVLVSAVRGCDSVPRDDPMKALTRFYRTCLLKAHCGDAAKAASFMLHVAHATEFDKIAKPVLRSLDHYPIHYLLHFMHAVEIMGYKLPLHDVRRYWWQGFYLDLCHKLHVNAETESQLDDRLNADEPTFAAAQQ